MKMSVDIDRGHYKASIEFSEEEGENLKDMIPKILTELDTAIKSSSGLWHSPMSQLGKLMILPSGSVIFKNPAISQIDQLVLLTGAGGTRGVTAQEASELLAIPYEKVTSRYTEEKYKKLFRRIEDGRYALSKEGVKRQSTILDSTDITSSRIDDEDEG